MAEETLIRDQLSDDRTVEISDNEISDLRLKISELEQKNDKINTENKEYKQKFEELKVSLEDLRSENVELKRQVEEAESDNKGLGAVAARASELEGEVSRLQHDLVSTMSDLEESNAESSEMKKKFEELKEKEKEKDVVLSAVVKERDLLVAKVAKLEGSGSGLRGELEGKEKEIQDLKKNLQEFDAVVTSYKSLEKLKNELEKSVEKLKGEISVLDTSLEEKEKIICGLELNEKVVVDGGVNGDLNRDGVVKDGNKGLIGERKRKDWIVAGGSTVAAVAVMGVACYIHAAKKH